MIIAMVEYINKYGRITVKGFADEEKLNKFVSGLAARGTEYIVTRI